MGSGGGSGAAANAAAAADDDDDGEEDDDDAEDDDEVDDPLSKAGKVAALVALIAPARTVVEASTLAGAVAVAAVVLPVSVRVGTVLLHVEVNVVGGGLKGRDVEIDMAVEGGLDGGVPDIRGVKA